MTYQEINDKLAVSGQEVAINGYVWMGFDEQQKSDGAPSVIWVGRRGALTLRLRPLPNGTAGRLCASCASPCGSFEYCAESDDVAQEAVIVMETLRARMLAFLGAFLLGDHAGAAPVAQPDAAYVQRSGCLATAYARRRILGQEESDMPQDWPGDCEEWDACQKLYDNGQLCVAAVCLLREAQALSSCSKP